jgi:Phage portal protein, SPP1 Gp6-like
VATITTSRDEAVRLLDLLYRQLVARQGMLKLNSDYYDGQHPLEFATPQFAKYWGKLFSEFSDNWCGVVVDSKTERLVVRGVRIGQEAADKDFWRVWQTNGLDADSGLAFVDALAQGRSYVLVWGNPDDEETPEVTFESPQEAIVGYVPGSRRKRRAALKSWIDRDEHIEYATLYLPDSMWKFQRSSSAILDRSPLLGGTVASGGGLQWDLRDIVDEDNPHENPMGEVPMVELPNRSRLATEPISEITNVIPLQNAVNIVWSHLLTASDFAAFPQRVILGMEVPKQPVVNDAGDVVGHVPLEDPAHFAVDRVIALENPEASIAQWAAADLSNYTNVIEVAVGHIAAQTRTPPHYLVGRMANLSADALKAAETGLISTVYEKQLYFGEAIREMARLVTLAQGNMGKADGMRTATVEWRDPESRSEAELADALGKLATMLHVPDKILWRRYGFTDAEIEEMGTLQDEQQRADLALIKSVGEVTPPVTPAPTPPVPPPAPNGGGPFRKQAGTPPKPVRR